MAVVRLIWICNHFNDPDTLPYALWVGPFAILEVNIALCCNCAIFLPSVWKAAPSMSLTSLLQRNDGSSRLWLQTRSRTGHTDKEGSSRNQSGEVHAGNGGYNPDSMELDEGSTRGLAANKSTV
ncbi:hypothetical protein GLAREA_04262 [Glarea lozoyensis ATCC 20868]|uniref:Uncharacterized protein n=1 Tax=Glarea lozoyensis (strain ATCC 20868 / MF5171) TaxID=1116229 RepID=S3D5V1_GLAL2|nr:uncharacterized protein GLAREA_04262 [Glarea lozoyensis ATCC 20868]EPE27471.1 hypothetical protein GLAREA_04262 [Glarea lozoyensis ATCC 20868]